MSQSALAYELQGGTTNPLMNVDLLRHTLYTLPDGFLELKTSQRLAETI